MNRKFLILLIIGSLFSCEENSSPDPVFNKDLLINNWMLININDIGLQFIIYDSLKCIDYIPYGYMDGTEIELNSTIPPNVNGFTDYRYLEKWDFTSKDSLIIRRDGEVPQFSLCVNNEPVSLISPGFEVFIYDALWDINGNKLTIGLYGDNSGFYNYVIDSLTVNFLKLKNESDGESLSFISDF